MSFFRRATRAWAGAHLHVHPERGCQKQVFLFRAGKQNISFLSEKKKISSEDRERCERENKRGTREVERAKKPWTNPASAIETGALDVLPAARLVSSACSAAVLHPDEKQRARPLACIVNRAFTPGCGARAGLPRCAEGGPISCAGAID